MMKNILAIWKLYLFDIYAPVGNKAHPRGQAKDLRKELSDRIDAFHADEKELLFGKVIHRKKLQTIFLQNSYKGKRHTSTFNYNTHEVKYNKIVYSSPSAAAHAVTNKNVNGLLFWKGKDKKGNLVPLRKLI